MHGEYPVTSLIPELAADNLLPAILFRTSRKQCDLDVQRSIKSRHLKLDSVARTRINDAVLEIVKKYAFEEEIIFSHPQFEALLDCGVGAHHAGQLLIWRLLLEELMTRGVLRLMIATGTVAAGVDFPARTVVISAHSKRGSEGFSVLTAAELQQMSGRAGRRGKDSVGICLVAPGQFSDARVISEIANKPAEPLRSAYFAAPSTVLNLLKYRNVDDLRFTVSKSLAAFLDRKAARVLRHEVSADDEALAANKTLGETARKKAIKRIRRKERDASILESHQETVLDHSLEGLRKLGYLEGGSLTEKGYWAANLCTSLVLELSETIEEGIFYDLSLPYLVGLVASIAGDPHRPYFTLRENPIPKDLFRKMEEMVNRVRDTYGQGTNEVKVQPEAALTVMTWMDCEGWPEFSGLLRLSGVAEGDAARLITQTADHLGQISRLIESHPELARTAQDAREKILKPPLTESLAID